MTITVDVRVNGALYRQLIISELPETTELREVVDNSGNYVKFRHDANKHGVMKCVERAIGNLQYREKPHRDVEVGQMVEGREVHVIDRDGNAYHYTEKAEEVLIFTSRE